MAVLWFVVIIKPMKNKSEEEICVPVTISIPKQLLERIDAVRGDVP